MASPARTRGPGPDVALTALRGRAQDVAYRMLGSVADAEDVAQEALLRLDRSGVQPREPLAWITTVATRLAIDRRRSAAARNETYVGTWLPAPLLRDPASSPERRAETSEAVSQALLVALERLTPPQRAALVLRDAFGYDHERLAATLGRSEAACRQLVRRARRALGELDDPPAVDTVESRALLEAFLAAAEDGDVDALKALLTRDAVLYGDGGGVVEAVAEPVRGARQVAAFLVAVAERRRALGPFVLEHATVNGRPGRTLRDERGTVWDVLAIDVADGRVRAVRVQRNPEKLRHLDASGG